MYCQQLFRWKGWRCFILFVVFENHRWVLDKGQSKSLMPHSHAFQQLKVALDNDQVLYLFVFFQEEELTISCCSWYQTFPFWPKIWSVVIMEVLSFILSLSSATSKTQTYFQHINVFMMLLTIIITMVMIRNITAVMIITKYSLPTVDFATRYSTRYSDFLLQPYSNPTRSQKTLLVLACPSHPDSIALSWVPLQQL